MIEIIKMYSKKKSSKAKSIDWSNNDLKDILQWIKQRVDTPTSMVCKSCSLLYSVLDKKTSIYQ